MDAIRISATDIDAFRRFRDDEEAELAPLLAQLRRETEPTPAMAAGTALHSALERLGTGEFTELVVDGYTFAFAFDHALDLLPIRECKATAEYEIGGAVVTLVAKVDGVHGTRIDDHKLTGRFDAERYLASYQWRIYLDVFRANVFRWNVFEGEEAEPGRYVLRDLHPLVMHRYPGLREDIERELAAFVGFARIHLPERFRPTESASGTPAEAAPAATPATSLPATADLRAEPATTSPSAPLNGGAA